MTTNEEKPDEQKGAGSFCIPRAVCKALIDAKATAYEICAYLILARFTDESGVYSTASISAINRYTGANKTKGGPIDKAIKRLLTIQVKREIQVSNRLSGRKSAMVNQNVDVGPILINRDTLEENTSWQPELYDGPSTERNRVHFILPHFDESLDSRIWFGNNLVSGVGDFDHPLKVLKDAGDVAARLLIDLYANNDMEIWGGVRPIGSVGNYGPWNRYERISTDLNFGNVHLIRAKSEGHVAPTSNMGSDVDSYWRALEALESAGFIYEVIMVLNRNSVKKTFSASSGGEEYGAIPDDAEPLYELDCLSKHGYKPKGEEGVAGMTARTAGELRYSVADEYGQFDGTYAAFVRSGFPAMIAGIYRLRFRVSNVRNAGVRGAWARIYEGNREAKELIQRIRKSYNLEPIE